MFRRESPTGRLTVMLLLVSFISATVFIFIPGTRGQDTIHLEACYFENSPFIFTTGSGHVSGMARELMDALSPGMALDIEYSAKSISECRDSLLSGESDIWVGAMTEGYNTSSLTFCSIPVYSTWGVIYTNPESDIRTILDLDGRWVGVLKGDPFYNGSGGLEDLIVGFGIDTTIVSFDTVDELIGSLEDGGVDAAVLNNAVGSYLEGRRDILKTPIVFDPMDVTIAVSSERSDMTDILSEIGKEIDALRKDPDSVYYSILDSYIKNSNERPSESFIPSWLLRTILILLAAVIFLSATALILRHRVRVKTRELEEANRSLIMDNERRKEIERKLVKERNRSHFYLDLLIHDIGNIHQGMVNYIQLEEMMSPKEVSDSRALREIRSLVQRSISLVRNIHKFSEATREELSLRRMDIAPIIRDNLMAAVLGASDRNIQIDVKIPKEGVHVMCEPLIGELFLNLFQNAVKFQEGKPFGKVSVRVTRVKDGRWYRMEISDRGKGIPDSMKSTIFDRLERSTERKHRGMGLTLVKVLTERYGGSIDVKDRVPGDHTKGSLFILHLPAAPDDVDEGEGGAASPKDGPSV